MAQIQRKTEFKPGTFMSSADMNSELNNLVNAHNDNDTIVQRLNDQAVLKDGIQAGATDTVFVNYGNKSTVKTITFPKPFAKAPIVTVTPWSTYRDSWGISYRIYDVTSTSFKLSVYNESPNYDYYAFFNWIAVLN